MQRKGKGITNRYPSLVHRSDLASRCLFPATYSSTDPATSSPCKMARERNYKKHAFITDLRISINQTCKYNKATLIHMHVEEIQKLYWWSNKVQGMIQPEAAQSSIISPAEKNLLLHLLQSKSPNSSIETTTILCEYQIPASWISWGRDPFIEFWREHQPIWCVTHVLLNSSYSLSVLWVYSKILSPTW